MKQGFQHQNISGYREQSAPLYHLLSKRASDQKSSKSSEVFIEEDDGPSLGMKNSDAEISYNQKDNPILTDGLKSKTLKSASIKSGILNSAQMVNKASIRKSMTLQSEAKSVK